MKKTKRKYKEPGLSEAYNKSVESNLTILKYTWTFYIIFIGGLLILAQFYLEEASPLIIILLALFGIVVNLIYYKWIRNR